MKVSKILMGIVVGLALVLNNGCNSCCSQKGKCSSMKKHSSCSQKGKCSSMKKQCSCSQKGKCSKKKSCGVKLTRKWVTEAVLKDPESAVYDAKRNVIYVSSIDGDGKKKDNNGFISILSLDGKVKNLKWITGLDAPKGITISNDKLYATDIDTLVVIDIAKSKIIKKHTIKEGKFFNDVTADKQGNIYLTDMLDNAIYKLENNKLSLWLKTEDLAFPNGIYAEDDKLLTASWGILTDGFMTDIPGHLKTVDYKTKKVTDYKRNESIGNIDSIAPDGNGGYFLSDWIAGNILYFNKCGKASLIFRLGQGAADMDYIQDKKLLIVPVMKSNNVVCFEVK